MAMTPQERLEFDNLKKLVSALQAVRDVPFIEELKRRVVDQAVTDALVGINLGDLANVNDNATTGQVIKKQANGTWAGANDIDT